MLTRRPGATDRSLESLAEGPNSAAPNDKNVFFEKSEHVFSKTLYSLRGIFDARFGGIIIHTVILRLTRT